MIIFTIITFLIILAVLVFIHELGHFLIAKLFGIQVDEFALGFPPRIYAKKFGETTYAINSIPFGGYVKIFGEDPDDESLKSKRSITSKNKFIQVAVLVAGITFNILFAWFLLSITFMSGTLASVNYVPGYAVTDPRVEITGVEPKSNAEITGLQAGDTIISLTSKTGTLSLGQMSVTAVQKFIQNDATNTITLVFERDNKNETVQVAPQFGLIPDKAAIGISMDEIGILKLPFFEALYQGGKITIQVGGLIVGGLYSLVHDLILGHADLSQVSGPIGIVNLVGQASKLGFSYLLSFTAFISLNLAIINLLPFPALDGGRVLFVIIEAIKRSPIRPKIANTANMIGFSILILLMIIITVHDIINLIIK